MLEDGGELVTLSPLVWNGFLNAAREAPADRFPLGGLRRHRA